MIKSSAMVSSFKLFFLPPREHRARHLALVILALAPFLFGALALALGQDANWDLRNYHWYNAYAFLNGRYDLDLLPSQTPYFYNPLLDVPFYLLATHVPARVAGFALGFIQGLNFILLFMLAHACLIVPNARHKVIASAGLAALGMLGGGGIALIGTTFYDNVTSLGLFTSALLVLRFYDRFLNASWRRALFLAYLSGVPAGLMMGLKLPIVIFCVGFCFALLCLSGNAKRRLLIAFGFGLGILCGIALTFGYWGWFLDAHFGSPLFPYFNEIFKSPLAPLTSARDTQYVQRSLHDVLLYPFIFTASPFRTGEIEWRDWRIPLLYTLLPLALLLRLFFGRAKKRADIFAVPFAARYLLWAAVLSYVAWLGMFCIYRYAIPLEMLAPLLIVCAANMLPFRLQTRALVTAFLLLIVAFSIEPGNWSRRSTWSDRFIEADIPTIDRAAKPMLLMAGYDPYSHLVTLFPPDIPVIRIQSNFASPEQGKGINDMIRARIDAHHGAFLLLIAPWQEKDVAKPLGFFGLRLTGDACQKVVDRLYGNSELALCPVARLPNEMPESHG